MPPWPRIDDRRLSRRPAPIAASGSDNAGGDRIRARFADRRRPARREPRRTRPGNWRRIMRPRPSFGSARPASRRTKPRSISAARSRAARPSARLDLSPSGDLVEAASHLFSYLRALDAAGAARIAVAPIPAHGLGAAINDRLRRAAAPRRTLNDGAILCVSGLGNGKELAIEPSARVGGDERRPIVGIMNSGLSWDEFRLVKSIAEARSLVGAAERLGVNHSTVFRRLAAVESAVGARLFERSRAGYEPTAAGEEMIALAATMAESVLEFERRVAGRDIKPTGELSVTTPEAIGQHFMPAIVAQFQAQNPGIVVELILSNQIAQPQPARRRHRDSLDQRPAGNAGWKENLHRTMGRLLPARPDRGTRRRADRFGRVHRI